MGFVFKKLSHHEPGKGEHASDLREIEITANGIYDATAGSPGGVGDLEAGAQYVYKYDIIIKIIVK